MSAAHRLACEAMTALRPAPNIAVSDWMEQHLLLPEDNAVPGPFRFDNTPYLREVVDSFNEPDVETVSLMWGAQLGKTTGLLGILAYCVGHRPKSSMVLQATEADAKAFLATKLLPLFEHTPIVATKLAKPRGRSGTATATHRDFEGGALHLAWSGSGASLRGRSLPVLLADECDAYADLDEGHPLDLSRKRTATFGEEAKKYQTSTPTIAGASRISDEYEDGDQRSWWVRCPHCGTEQVMEWGRKTPDGWLGVVWDRDAGGQALRETARYRCLHCAGDWSEPERIDAIRGGQWIAARPEIASHRSYWLPAWYSLLIDLPSLVADWYAAKRSGDMRTWTNLAVGKPFESRITQFRPPRSVEERRAREEDWGPHMPEAVQLVTIGVDTQADRLEAAVYGWGAGETAWRLDYQTLWGDPQEPGGVWNDILELHERPWVSASGKVLKARLCFIDSGGTAGMTAAVYRFCQGKQRRGIFAIKGMAGWDGPVVRKAKTRTTLREHKVYLVTLAVDQLKRMVIDQMAIADPDAPGFVHVPRGTDPTWWEGMASETLVGQFRFGRRSFRWQLASAGARNEPLDCAVYAKGARIASGVRLGSLVDTAATDAAEEAPDAEDQAAPKRRLRTRVKGAGRRVRRP